MLRTKATTMMGSDDNNRRGGSRAEWNWYSAERGAVAPDAQGITLAEMISAKLQIIYPAAPTDTSEAIDLLLAKLAAKGV
jgi:hypothetical protein